MVTLESSKLFSQLPPLELDRLRGSTKELRFAAGQAVFREGDPGDGVYVVKSGAVQIAALMGTGESRVIARVPPGDVFGELTLLDNQPRSAAATAEVDTEVYFVPREPMVHLLKSSPELSMTLVQEISGRLREFNRQYVREVLQAERMQLVGRFASSIVHDLKNPLAIIAIATDMACAENSTPAARRLARDRMTQQVDRITSLVNDILEYTRGTPTAPTFAQTDYAAFVQTLVAELQQDASLKSVTIEYENPPPAVSLALNHQRLGRVFYNLIDNAADAMPDGGVIKLRFDVTDLEVLTEVEDTGKGIAPEILDRLFEPFATFGKASGTGLGLSIARRIVQEHGGCLSARNSVNGGAIFAFMLPRKR
jgi:signal transduction histidine kinase